jgi:hypothetical protein
MQDAALPCQSLSLVSQANVNIHLLLHRRAFSLRPLTLQVQKQGCKAAALASA